MIAGIFHQGSGLGNQLFRYITTRTLAKDKGYEWGMVNPFLFKGLTLEAGKKGFMQDLQMGSARHLEFSDVLSVEQNGLKRWHEKKVMENGVDIRGYDPEINFVEDRTIIDGEFQDIRYWGHKLKDIDKWLKVEPINKGDFTCMIGFRGGEYSIFPDLFLPKSYWDEAIQKMRNIIPEMKFEVHTDDPELAKKFFPDFPVVHDIGYNWRSFRYCKYAIVSNSSFYILPLLLNDKNVWVFAPRYWARHNTKTWALPQNYYAKFNYL